MVKEHTVFMGESCEVARGKYRGGNISLQLIDADGMPFATATVWVEGLAKDEVAIKDYSENAGMLSALLLSDIVFAPHRYVKSGFVTIPVCRLVNK